MIYTGSMTASEAHRMMFPELYSPSGQALLYPGQVLPSPLATAEAYPATIPIGSGTPGVPEGNGAPGGSYALPVVGPVLGILGAIIVAIRAAIAAGGMKAVLALIPQLVTTFGKSWVLKGLAQLGLSYLLFRAFSGSGDDDSPMRPGDVVNEWEAGPARFREVVVATKRGFTVRREVWQPKRGLWVAVRVRHNIVIGAKTLAIASTLGHKRRIGKRRVLQIIATPYPRRSSPPHFEHHRRHR